MYVLGIVLTNSICASDFLDNPVIIFSVMVFLSKIICQMPKTVGSQCQAKGN